MIRNYIKIAFRNLLKNKLFSAINIFGLAIGIASAVLISDYVKFEHSYESIHENAENIFRVTIDLYNEGEFVVNDAMTYFPIGGELTEQMPEVENFVRLMPWEKTQIKTNDRVFFEEDIYFADPSVFEIFSYKVLYGEPIRELEKPYKAAISQRMANKYFGKSDVVGEAFYFNTNPTPIEIVGVFEDIPQNTHLKFDFLLSHESIPAFIAWNYLDHPWTGNNEYTYLQMAPGTSVADFNRKLKAYSLNHPQIEDEILIAEAIPDIHLYSNKSYEPEVNGSAQTVKFMAIIALVIIVLAWINYINLSTSRALERGKEVGVRKVVGSSRGQLIKQFLIESFIVNLLACGVAFTVVQLTYPAFIRLTGQSVSNGLMWNGQTWLIFIIILLTGTLLSGIYPALILSSYKPALVLKGKFSRSSSGQLMRKGLVLFQFFATVLLIAISLAVYFQLNFLNKQDLGVNVNNALVIHQPMITDNLDSKMKAFEKELEAFSIVSSVAQSDVVPGADIKEIGYSSGVSRVGQERKNSGYAYYLHAINEDYLSALNIELVSGRNFQLNEPEKHFIINERAAKLLGFPSPKAAVMGKITFGGDDHYEIIGVVNNFFQRSPKEEMLPLIFEYATTGYYYTVKLNTAETGFALDQIKDKWQSHFPESAFDYEFLDDKYGRQYQNDQRLASVTLIFTLISIVIAMLGLFGLTSYSILQRTKEIGIRKVLGASVLSIVRLLSRDLLKYILLAGLIAIPVAYFAIDIWLQNYHIKMQLTWWLFAIPIAIILIIAFLAVIGQTLKSALADPVKNLRYE